MRKLSVNQKKALKVWYKGSGSCILDDMNSDELDRIYEMNDYETFHQDASRYLWDLNILA